MFLKNPLDFRFGVVRDVLVYLIGAVQHAEIDAGDECNEHNQYPHGHPHPARKWVWNHARACEACRADDGKKCEGGKECACL